MRYAPIVALLLLSPAASAAPKTKAAGKASPPACGAKILPLVVGNTWTYGPVAAPAALPEALARLAPAQPKSIVVEVKSIEKKGTDSVVSLEEKITFDMTKDPKEPKTWETVVKSQIVCNDKGKFDISPESFFFAGEPGGVHGMAFENFTRKKETSLKLTKGTIGENEWIEEITSKFTRTPAKGSEGTKLVGGTLELERKFTPQPPESVITRAGKFTAEKLGLITSGRVKFDKVLSPEGKPCNLVKLDPKTNVETKTPSESCELPANWISTLWIADGTGLVQALNSYAHMYQLNEVVLK
jgi:hypothetical protein